MTPQELARAADDRTACVCYFGGDPSCNPQHSIDTSKILYTERGIAVCYETNGNISSKWLSEIAAVVIESGGTIKFDLKAKTPSLYKALTGTDNVAVLNNFRRLAEMGKEQEKTFLVASILLIPSYIDLEEITLLCEFISVCDPSVPTALLGFAPRHFMTDLPRTSRTHADEALKVAKDCGLENVRVGNVHLLSNEEYTI